MAGGKIHQAILILMTTFFLYGTPSHSLPLSTDKRWIIDAKSGQRVKLNCINWPSHIGPMLAEGLHKQPLHFIASQVVDNAFNCVRLTWATYMFTRAEYEKLTVLQSFDGLNLTEAKAGIAMNNGALLNMSVRQAFDTVVDVLAAHGIMLILDNHVSLPIWCCSNDDGNGFFGDIYFDPEEWLRGLLTVASRFKGKLHVVAIGLRNELRGPHQNVSVWYKYVPEAAKKVHEINPDVLIFASGLSYATDLRFLKEKPLDFNLDNKLVMEAHQYSWSITPVNTSVWVDQPINQVCANEFQVLDDSVGFVNGGENNQVPLVFGEFGINQKNVSLAEDHFLSCFLAYIAERDLDWSLWALQGGYYYREGKIGIEDDFGLLDANWDHVKNPKLQERFQFIKEVIQDPNTNSSTSYIMYHPQSGRCVEVNEINGVHGSNCKTCKSRWSHNGDESPIKLVDTDLCLKLDSDGLSPILSDDCLSQQSTWKSLSSSKLHLAARDDDGKYMCLHMENSGSLKIVTKECVCVGEDPQCKSDSTSQWFKLVLTNLK